MGKKYTGHQENCNHTLSPAMKEAGAKKAGGVAITIPTCRVAMLQKPQKVADPITEAAKGSAKAARPITTRDNLLCRFRFATLREKLKIKPDIA